MGRSSEFLFNESTDRRIWYFDKFKMVESSSLVFVPWHLGEPADVFGYMCGIPAPCHLAFAAESER
ncbi:MAG: hypothetical protein CMK32_07895 [Porticoccaceae bacterium]|nr:hypothetical protein [Porticoccaceae bacterium]